MVQPSLKDYKVLEQIGEGAFSVVYRVKLKKTRALFAAKLLKEPSTSEVQMMQVLEYHPNVISIVDVVRANEQLTIIMELMDMSLYDYIKNRKRCLSEKRVKQFFYQIVKGLNHLHRSRIFHRDIKPENILVKLPRKANDPELVQLADLGSTCNSERRLPYTPYVSTRWYRAPECLLMNGYYGPKMDVWAVGCCIYEMLTLKPLFPGDNEMDMLHIIHEILGTPSQSLLAKFKNLCVKPAFPRRRPVDFRVLLPLLSNYGIDILRRTLAYHPDNRISSEKLIDHVYFDDLIKRKMPSKRSLSVEILDDGGGGDGNNRSLNFCKASSGKDTVSRSFSLNGSLRSMSSNTSSHEKLGLEIMKNKTLERLWGMNPGPGKNKLQYQMKRVSIA